MSGDETLRSDELPAGSVARLGRWAVVRRRDAPAPEAVTRRCRHQLGDLSAGSLDANGCLVCPWHGARYDVTTGAMVSGPRGFLTYRGKVPGFYAGAILALGKVAKLRIGRVREADGKVTVSTR